MFQVNSERAKKILAGPSFFVSSPESRMRTFPSKLLPLQALVESEQGVVKKLSFFGSVPEGAFLVVESMASLLIGKKISRLNELTVRECEAFLRDRNSVPAFEGLTPDLEEELKRFFTWLHHSSFPTEVRSYEFPLSKGAFASLGLVDKVRELKAFFNSPEVSALYEGGGLPEVLDVEDLTVYVQAPYASDRDRVVFERLHELGVETFREENLNFIPES